MGLNEQQTLSKRIVNVLTYWQHLILLGECITWFMKILKSKWGIMPQFLKFRKAIRNSTYPDLRYKSYVLKKCYLMSEKLNKILFSWIVLKPNWSPRQKQGIFVLPSDIQSNTWWVAMYWSSRSSNCYTPNFQ